MTPMRLIINPVSMPRQCRLSSIWTWALPKVFLFHSPFLDQSICSCWNSHVCWDYWMCRRCVISSLPHCTSVSTIARSSKISLAKILCQVSLRQLFKDLSLSDCLFFGAEGLTCWWETCWPFLSNLVLSMLYCASLCCTTSAARPVALFAFAKLFVCWGKVGWHWWLCGPRNRRTRKRLSRDGNCYGGLITKVSADHVQPGVHFAVSVSLFEGGLFL